MGKDLKGKELGPGLMQRKDGMYRYRFKDYYGNTKDVYGRTLQEVKAKAIESARGDVTNPKTAASRITLNQLFDVWIDDYKKADIKPATYSTYKSNYNEHIRNTELGKMPVVKITPLDVKRIFNDIQASYRASTARILKTIIVELMDFSVDEDIIMKNKMRSISVKSAVPSKKKNSLTREQQEEFMSEARKLNSRYYNAFVILLNAGVRIGELCSIRLSDINFEKRYVSIRRTLFLDTGKSGDERYVFNSPKNGQERKVPLNDEAYHAFQSEMEYRNKLICKKQKEGKEVDERFSDILLSKYNFRFRILNFKFRIVSKLASKIQLQISYSIFFSKLE